MPFDTGSAEGWKLMFPPIYSGAIDRSNLMYRVVDKEFLCVFERIKE